MSVTFSRSMPVGVAARLFELPDAVSGKLLSLKELKSEVTVVMFLCNHCPYVKHVEHELAEVG